jgi:hypothetical protein
MANNGLTAKQTKTISALLSAPSNQAAAEAAGVGYRTLTRWLLDPVFLQALKRAETDLLNNGIRELVKDLAKNRETMTAIRDNTEVPDSVRLRAAIGIDNSLMRWLDLQSIDERLTALESAYYSK